MKRRIVTTVWLGALVFAAGAAQAQSHYPGNAVRVNGVELSYQRFAGFYQEYQANKGVAIGARGDQVHMLKRLRREAMDQFVEQELVAQAAEAAGIEVDPAEVDATFENLRDGFDNPQGFAARLRDEGFDEASYRTHLGRLIGAKRYLDDIRMQVAEVSDEELEAYYQANERRLTLPEQVRVRHILRSWKPTGKPDDRAALYDEIAPILEQARSGSDFAELARIHSQDSTAKNGGDTGFFHRGQMVAPFEEAAFALQPGEISDIVKTSYGLHVIKLEERREEHLLPLDEIREQLRQHIREEKQEEAVQAEYRRLREAADIEILIQL